MTPEILVVTLALAPLLLLAVAVAFFRWRGRVHDREVTVTRLGTWLSSSRSVTRGP